MLKRLFLILISVFLSSSALFAKIVCQVDVEKTWKKCICEKTNTGDFRTSHFHKGKLGKKSLVLFKKACKSIALMKVVKPSLSKKRVASNTAELEVKYEKKMSVVIATYIANRVNSFKDTEDIQFLESAVKHLTKKGKKAKIEIKLKQLRKKAKTEQDKKDKFDLNSILKKTGKERIDSFSDPQECYGKSNDGIFFVKIYGDDWLNRCKKTVGRKKAETQKRKKVKKTQSPAGKGDKNLEQKTEAENDDTTNAKEDTPKKKIVKSELDKCIEDGYTSGRFRKWVCERRIRIAKEEAEEKLEAEKEEKKKKAAEQEAKKEDEAEVNENEENATVTASENSSPSGGSATADEVTPEPAPKTKPAEEKPAAAVKPKAKEPTEQQAQQPAKPVQTAQAPEPAEAVVEESEEAGSFWDMLGKAKEKLGFSDNEVVTGAQVDSSMKNSAPSQSEQGGYCEVSRNDLYVLRHQQVDRIKGTSFNNCSDVTSGLACDGKANNGSCVKEVCDSFVYYSRSKKVQTNCNGDEICESYEELFNIGVRPRRACEWKQSMCVPKQSCNLMYVPNDKKDKMVEDDLLEFITKAKLYINNYNSGPLFSEDKNGGFTVVMPFDTEIDKPNFAIKINEVKASEFSIKNEKYNHFVKDCKSIFKRTSPTVVADNSFLVLQVFKVTSITGTYMEENMVPTLSQLPETQFLIHTNGTAFNKIEKVGGKYNTLSFKDSKVGDGTKKAKEDPADLTPDRNYQLPYTAYCDDYNNDENKHGDTGMVFSAYQLAIAAIVNDTNFTAANVEDPYFKRAEWPNDPSLWDDVITGGYPACLKKLTSNSVIEGLKQEEDTIFAIVKNIGVKINAVLTLSKKDKKIVAERFVDLATVHLDVKESLRHLADSNPFGSSGTTLYFDILSRYNKDVATTASLEGYENLIPEKYHEYIADEMNEVHCKDKPDFIINKKYLNFRFFAARINKNLTYYYPEKPGSWMFTTKAEAQTYISREKFEEVEFRETISAIVYQARVVQLVLTKYLGNLRTLRAETKTIAGISSDAIKRARRLADAEDKETDTEDMFKTISLVIGGLEAGVNTWLDYYLAKEQLAWDKKKAMMNQCNTLGDMGDSQVSWLMPDGVTSENISMEDACLRNLWGMNQGSFQPPEKCYQLLEMDFIASKRQMLDCMGVSSTPFNPVVPQGSTLSSGSDSDDSPLVPPVTPEKEDEEKKAAAAAAASPGGSGGGGAPAKNDPKTVVRNNPLKTNYSGSKGRFNPMRRTPRRNYAKAGSPGTKSMKDSLKKPTGPSGTGISAFEENKNVHTKLINSSNLVEFKSSAVKRSRRRRR